MVDLLEELKNIRLAELKAKEIVTSANKKAEALSAAAMQKRAELLSKVPEQSTKIKEDASNNYRKTYTLILTKLDRDYSKRIKSIEGIDTKALSRSIASAVFVVLKNYGKSTPNSKADE